MTPADDEAVVVLVTAPDEAMLVSMAETLVREGLVACVNIVPAVRSVYTWDDALVNEREALGIIKTARRAVPELRRRVMELHSYDVPEFLSLAVDMADSRYLDWILSSVPDRES